MATDANPLVRSSVVQSLEPWVQSDGEEPAVIGRMLLDPSRSVRVRAAWVLRRDLDLQSVAGREMMHFLESNADQPGGRLQQSVFAMDRGETGQALVHARAAAGWDSHSAAARHELAVILSLAGKPVEAVAALKEAVKLEPDESEYHYKLALALHEAGEPQKALQALENVVSRFPTHDRAWYNLGLSRQAAGDQAGGIEALLRAESIVPADPRIPYARGTILMQSGDVVGARRALERVLEIDPGHSEARDLLSRLPR